MSKEKRFTPSVSLTETEREWLKMKAKEVGISYTLYMKEVALCKRTQDGDRIGKDNRLKQLLRQISGIATNINQLAKKANETGHIDVQRFVKELVSKDRHIDSELQRFGYKGIRFPGKDIRENLETAVQKVEEAVNIFQENGRILRISDAEKEGIHNRTLYYMLEEGHIEKLERGLYKLAGEDTLSNPSLVIVAKKIPKARICLISALALS